MNPLPVWVPSPDFIETTNIAWLTRQANVASYEALHRWSVENRAAYWKLAIERLGIRFQRTFNQIVDLSDGVENARWLPGARLNIVESCFTAPAEAPAIVQQKEGGALQTVSVLELQRLAGQVAANLRRLGFDGGEAIGMLMPMTAESVAIYLGIIQSGCVAVGIADSFQPKEIAARLRIANVRAVFTQDVLLRGGKEHPLYANLIDADAPLAIVLTAGDHLRFALRPNDCAWEDFLVENDAAEVCVRGAADPLTILFSSGTTGDPKAIPWTQTTPIKCAADAHFHQDVHPGDVVVWPTNIGWMMGPWLIFASLINKAAIGLYSGAPTGRDFGRFVQDAKATMLGVVPSLVKAWRQTDCMDGLDWSALRLFSSTGECSNAEDMRWLSSLAGGRPIIEYCGGTEIGGAYITSSVTLPNFPATFNSPTLGLDVVILNDQGQLAKTGELYLVPPSIGLSETLLNKDHHEIYFAGAPRGPNGEILRRHGDEMEKLPGGGWRAHGRADDTMNLGGIKVSSAEIERALQSVPNVLETAAIAVSPNDGPSLLVIYAVCVEPERAQIEDLLEAMQSAIKRDLNPLFKIHDLLLISALPRTASNKVMRRKLRSRYLNG
ncbi:MAG TPA: AMP-binding protein [Chthoniobacteraceae bacterium]